MLSGGPVLLEEGGLEWVGELFTLTASTAPLPSYRCGGELYIPADPDG